MLPNIENTDDLILDVESEEQENTKTYAIRQITAIPYIGGMIDGVEALKQHIYLTLNTEADQYIIYPYTYGLQTLDLIGKPHYYVMAIIPDRIRDALLSDDRITDVTDFEFTADGKKLHVQFIVHSIYGNLEEEAVVTY